MLRFGAHIVDTLVAVVDGLADVVLILAIVAVLVSGIDDAVLEFNESRLPAEIFRESGLQQRDKALCSAGIRLDVLNLERGLRLFGVEITQSPLEQLGRIGSNQLSASRSELEVHESGDYLGASHHRAEPRVAEHVVVHPLSTYLLAAGKHQILIRLEQVDIVALGHVRQRQLLAGEQLVEVPDASCVLAGGFGLHEAGDLFGPDCRKDCGQEAQIRPVILERELDVSPRFVARPVVGWISIHHPAGRSIRSTYRPIRDDRAVPVGHDIQAVSINQGPVARIPIASLFAYHSGLRS